MIIYVLSYVMWGLIRGYKFLVSSPNGEPQVNETYEEMYKEQTFSATLAGFTISALAFILATDSLSNSIHIVEFFSFAFVFEMLSFLSFKYMSMEGYDFFGVLFQFTGLLALLNGFFIFLIDEYFTTSYMIIIAYLIGYFGFFFLTTIQLRPYIESMKRHRS